MLNTLMEHLNSVYMDIKANEPQLKFNKVEDFISDDGKAAEFIRAILQDDDFQLPDRNNELYKVAKVRACHAAITFLIGLVFLEFNNFEQRISKSFFPNEVKASNLVIRMWMIAALYHDYGYYIDDLKDGKVDLKKGIRYYLLDDNYEGKNVNSLSDYSLHYQAGLAYTYDEIEAYDEYARRWHQQQNDEEKVDHGILGGVRIFHRLVSRAQKVPTDETELITIKTSCLAIAQHNIFKSNSKDADKNYGVRLKKLHFGSSFVIGNHTPLLFLLCLVDTFECVKRLSKGETKSDFLIAKTVLSSIQLSVTPKEIVVDYSELEKRVSLKDNKVQENYSKYKDSLLKIGTWTTLATRQDGEKVIFLNQADRVPIDQKLLVATSSF